MSFKKAIIGMLFILSVFSVAAFSQGYGYCKDFKCVGGLGDGTSCTTNTDCNLPPIESEQPRASNVNLYADITLGVMGVAVAAIITLVGFAIYAKGATPVKRSSRTRKVSSKKRSKTSKRRRR